MAPNHVVGLTQPEADSVRKKGRQVQSKHKKTTLGKNGSNVRKEIKTASCRGFRSSLKEGGSKTSHMEVKAAVISPAPELSLTDSDTNTEETVESDSVSVDPGAVMSEETGAKKISVPREADTVHGKKPAKNKRRYILFIGNLPKTSSHAEIVNHFKMRGVDASEFRLLTHKDTGKSKGCGFMELSSDKMMQNALKFHRSRLKGKNINVEVTCGGGGKSERRKAKIVKKNRILRAKKGIANPFKYKHS